LAKFILPPDERLPLSELVVGKPSGRRPDDRQKWAEVAWQVWMHQLPDPFGPIDVFQLVDAQVPNCQIGREGLANQIDSDARDKRLTAVGSRSQAGAVVDRDPVVIA
jgi:hypothetical protein